MPEFNPRFIPKEKMQAYFKLLTKTVLEEDNIYPAQKSSAGTAQVIGSQYRDNDDELEYDLPPYNLFVKYMVEDDPEAGILHELRCLLGLEEHSIFQYSSLTVWMYRHIDALLTTGYDYQNLYNPECSTAVYYFLEDIVLDFDDMDENEEFYPFGWFDFYAYCDRVGIKLPTYGEGGKYGKSMHWA